MNINEFRIVKNIKKYILSLDKILVNFPRKEKILKDKIKETSFDVLELTYCANTLEEKKEIQKQIISKLNMLDFYFEYAHKCSFISEKQCLNKTNELLAITKMIYGWIKNG